MPDQKLVTIKSAATQLSTTPRTVHRLIREGKLASVRLSERILRIPQASIDALAEE
ncbi:helix-turn-helix domain-containing protein [Rhodococcus sp. NPDC079359]|uniref:helix-turn-helix domain-containing protein n=1 Tax=unclassified Rhodococcus (in: high G+C Gram-positive bacteria) TaxID=192944 RepID=UPI00344BAFAB